MSNPELVNELQGTEEGAQKLSSATVDAEILALLEQTMLRENIDGEELAQRLNTSSHEIYQGIERGNIGIEDLSVIFASLGAQLHLSVKLSNGDELHGVKMGDSDYFEKTSDTLQ